MARITSMFPMTYIICIHACVHRKIHAHVCINKYVMYLHLLLYIHTPGNPNSRLRYCRSRCWGTIAHKWLFGFPGVFMHLCMYKIFPMDSDFSYAAPSIFLCWLACVFFNAGTVFFMLGAFQCAISRFFLSAVCFSLCYGVLFFML